MKKTVEKATEDAIVAIADAAMKAARAIMRAAMEETAASKAGVPVTPAAQGAQDAPAEDEQGEGEAAPVAPAAQDEQGEGEATAPFTPDEMAQAATLAVNTHGIAAVREILEQFGAQRVSEIPAEKQKEFLYALSRISPIALGDDDAEDFI